MKRCEARARPLAAVVLAAGVLAAAEGEAASARIVGRVHDPSGHGVGQVRLVLRLVRGGPTRETTTDATGGFSFDRVFPGTYVLRAEHPDYAPHETPPVVVAEGREVRVRIALRLAAFSETVVIEARPSEEPTDPAATERLDEAVLDVLPLPTDRFAEAFPLVPGVVRGPDGKLSFFGARASQSALLVNGSNVTDPLTGEFAIELPLRAIETVEVHSIPYSAEYGQATAAVANVVTRAGGDEWEIDVDHPLPRLRFRDGTIMGIKAATPRVQVSGPLVPGRAWLSQGVAYRFVRSRVYDMELPGEDEQIVDGYDSFTQLDVHFDERHRLTATFSYFPAMIENLGLDTLRSERATPDFWSWGWNVGVAERATLSSRTLVETSFAVKSFDVAVRPKGEGPARLTFEGLRGNYFDEIDRDSLRWEANASCTHYIPHRAPHVVKFGGRVAGRRFSGTDRGRRVEVLGRDGRLLETIDFVGEGRLEASDLELAAYVQDRWRLGERIGADLGLRYDYDRVTASHHLAPRLSVAVAPWRAGHTVFRAGWGVFYDQLLLHAASFERFQRRVETRYGPDGPVEAIAFANRIAPDRLELPRATMWNVEVDRDLGGGWMVRLNYRERRGSREPVVDRGTAGRAGPALLLSSRGRSMSRELDVTLKRLLPEEGELFLSYVKARTAGELNHFGALYGDERDPLILPSANELQPFDVPHRFLLWGVAHLPKGVTLVPGVEWRSGFPYTVLDEEYRVVGRRNRGGRFPVFFSADLQVTKELRLFGKDVRAGVQIFNLTNRDNPRDVVANRASDRFGTLRNGVGFRLRLRLELRF